jgi:hypothetical protein
MVHDEEVEFVGDLDSTLPEASGAKEGTGGEPAPPSDAGEGPMVTPALTCAGKDPVPAAAPTAGDTSVVGANQLPKTLWRQPALRRWRDRG